MSTLGLKPNNESRERGVFIPRWLMKACPTASSAAVLAEALWFYQPWLSGDEKTETVVVDGDKWLFLSDKDWEEWTGLDAQSIKRARVALAKKGLIDYRPMQRNGIKRVALLPNWSKLQELEMLDKSEPTWTPVQKSEPTQGEVGTDSPNKSEPTYPPLTTEVSEVKRVSAAAAATKKGTRIPEPFFVTAEMRQWAAEEVPSVDVSCETRKFCDYWRATPGAKGVKLDWVATWRNWLRSAAERGAGSSGPVRKTGGGHTDMIKRALARYEDDEGMVAR